MDSEGELFQIGNSMNWILGMEHALDQHLSNLKCTRLLKFFWGFGAGLLECFQIPGPIYRTSTSLTLPINPAPGGRTLSPEMWAQAAATGCVFRTAEFDRRSGDLSIH